MANRIDKITGKAKEKLGQVIGSEKLQAEGRAEQAAGGDAETAEEIREAVRGERPPG